MTAEDEKFMKFGRMVFGMMTDCLVMNGPAYARKHITFPTNAQGSARGSVELIVTPSAAIADLFEKTVADQYVVIDMPVSFWPW